MLGAIWVKPEVTRRGLHFGDHFRGGAEWVFVASDLDCARNSKLPLELFEWLPRLVGDHLLDSGGDVLAAHGQSMVEAGPLSQGPALSSLLRRYQSIQRRSSGS